MTAHMRLGFQAPETEEELSQLVVEAAEARTPLEIMGKGTKRELGHAVRAGAIVSTENMKGITLYEPTELVMVAKAGTPIAEIEAALAENDQELACEPVDIAPVLGYGPGDGTVGGLVATNISGSRRILKGAVRDHVLGIRAVNGRGEIIKSGGRVMKNVTGYDLARTLVGSWGTLAVMSEVALKVLPVQRESRTLVFFGLTDFAAVEALCLAMGTPYEVSGTLHLHAELAARVTDEELAGNGAAVTAIRVESFPASARYRTSRLREALLAYGPQLELDSDRSRVFWRDVQSLKMFQDVKYPLWRVSTVPSRAATLIGNLARKIDVRVAYDWSGGLVWIETPALADAAAVEIRRQLAEFGGHATLIRADSTIRNGTNVFQPLEPPHDALAAKLKHAFDPLGLFNPGRLYRDR
ncbi:glycolate oxidase subunit GlcE [Methyloceanibacter methanicus]|nr:glycolate oxidase subunit GlcE [Methyloceanibacter methanicus]